MRAMIVGLGNESSARWACRVFFALSAVALVLTISAIYSFVVAANKYPTQLFVGLFLIVCVSAVIISYLGYAAELSGQQARDITAKSIFSTVRSEDASRPFILYLRPFSSTDEIALTQIDLTSGSRGMSFFAGEVVELEAQFERASRAIGSLICLGRPLEHFGAGRVLTSEAEWIETVEALMKDATMIVVLPSTNSGTAREIDIILSGNLVRKTMFVDAPRSEKDSEYRNDIEWPGIQKLFEKNGYKLPAQRRSGQVFFYGDQVTPHFISRLDISDEDHIRVQFRKIINWLKQNSLADQSER